MRLTFRPELKAREQKEVGLQNEDVEGNEEQMETDETTHDGRNECVKRF